MLKRFWRDESGATAIEYALIGTIVGVGLVTSLTDLKTALGDSYDLVANSFP